MAWIAIRSQIPHQYPSAYRFLDIDRIKKQARVRVDFSRHIPQNKCESQRPLLKEENLGDSRRSD